MATLGWHGSPRSEAAQTAVRLDPISADSHSNLSNRTYSGAAVHRGRGRGQACAGAAPESRRLDAGPAWARSHAAGTPRRSLHRGRTLRPVDWRTIDGRRTLMLRKDWQAGGSATRVGGVAEGVRRQRLLSICSDRSATWRQGRRHAVAGKCTPRARSWPRPERHSVDPCSIRCRGDPRFEKLLRDLGFVKES